MQSSHPLQVEAAQATSARDVGFGKTLWLQMAGFGFGCFALGVACACLLLHSSSYVDSLPKPAHQDLASYVPMGKPLWGNPENAAVSKHPSSFLPTQPNGAARAGVAVMQEEEVLSEEELEALESSPTTSQSDATDEKSQRQNEAISRMAPWMAKDADKIAQAKAEREAFKAKQAQASANANRLDGGFQLNDPQAAELGAAGGVSSKVISEEEVELRWETQNEENVAGFIVQRRRGGSDNFETIASYEKFPQLRGKGPAGGLYVYLDDTTDVGTWVYRIIDCSAEGECAAVGQKLVEIESESQQKFTLIFGVVLLLLAAVAAAAATLYDPIQTTQSGRNVF